MKRLSMTNTLKGAQQSLRRFPLVLLCTLIATFAAFKYFEKTHINKISQHILMSATLGIPTLLALALAIEQQKWRPWKGWLLRVSGLLVLGLYAFNLPEPLPQSYINHFILLLAAGHLLVPVAPFFNRNSDQALWHFNIILFMRLVSSVLFTLVMYAGLTLALVALDQLLGMSLPDSLYWKLFVFLGFVFHTWYFLGGIPVTPRLPADKDDFPQPLRIFAQYILSTLVVVYLAIILIYMGKILITGVWPSGWIGWLVSGVSVVGILSVILLYPLQGKSGSTWLGVYFRLYHILMIPSVILLILAVSKRLNQYGLTESRYLLLVLSGWMMMILIVGLGSRRIKLRFIPLSLGLLALIISTGPWGAASLSRRSQMGRVQTQLEAAGLFADGKMTPDEREFNAQDWQDLISSVEYLINQNGVWSLDRWLTPEMTVLLDQKESNGELKYRSHWAQASLIVNELGLKPPEPAEKYFVSRALIGQGRLNAISTDELQYTLTLSLKAGHSVAFQWEDEQAVLSLTKKGDKLKIIKEDLLLADMPLNEVLHKLYYRGDSAVDISINSSDEMIFDYTNDKLRLRLIIHSIDFQPDFEAALVKEISGVLLLSDVENLEPGR